MRPSFIMADGVFGVDAHPSVFDGKITLSVVITCIVAASSGLIFGYDLGISGFFFLANLSLENSWHLFLFLLSYVLGPF